METQHKNHIGRTVTGCTWREFLLITLGAALLAVGLAWYAEPFGMVTGGITGISIIVANLSQSLFGFAIPMWITNLALNVPLFLVSGLQRGFRFVQKSMVGVIMLSAWLSVFENSANLFSVGDDIFLGSVVCGVLAGVGLGLVLRAGATTGGTDMLAAVLKRFIGRVSLSRLIFIIDAIIILLGFFVFGMVTTLYAVISVYITTKLISGMLDGMYFAKAAFIMSDSTEEIAQQISDVFDHSSTGIYAKGMYSKKDREMLFVVVYPKEVGTLRNIVKKIDPIAFMTVCDAREVLGEGFIEDHEVVLR